VETAYISVCTRHARRCISLYQCVGLGASHARNPPEPVRTPASEQVTAGMFTANNMKRSVLNVESGSWSDGCRFGFRDDRSDKVSHLGHPRHRTLS
jgi:hypothetical protein